MNLRLALQIGSAIVIVALIGAAAWLYTPDRPRAALEARYAAAPSEFLQIAGIRLHVRDTGPRGAPAVIFLHGFGASLHTWQSLADGLEQNYRVIRFDLPGFGLTGSDPTGNYTDARCIEIILALMDHLGLARAAIVGHSMGGRIAWTFASLHPERVDRLVLMAPDGFASPGIAYGATPKVPMLVRLLPYVMPTALLRASLRPAFNDPAVLTDPLLTRYRDMMLAPGVRAAVLARMEQQSLVPPEPLLRRIQAPTLLIWGEQDRMIPVSNAADYLRVLPNARLQTFPASGHLPQEEAPDATLNAIRGFLDAPAHGMIAQ